MLDALHIEFYCGLVHNVDALVIDYKSPTSLEFTSTIIPKQAQKAFQFMIHTFGE